ncbi:MAG: glycosyltransferase family 4 protein [Acidobacteriota bacterium]
MKRSVEQPNRTAILLIGNFLTNSLGTRHVSEDLAEQLTARGWPVITTSSYPGRLRRGLDMLLTIWRRRDDFAIAHIEVYAGLAFIWAELSAFLLRRLGKPYLLTLHGGSLPGFARRWPRRVRKLLSAAVTVTTPSTYLLEELGGFGAKLHLIPNAITITRYHHRSRSVLHPRLLWLRAFDHIYNPTLALAVVDQLRDEFPELSLVMIGPDKGDGSLELTRQRISELKLNRFVTLTGRLSKMEIASQLDAADIFLNTTSVDNFPVSVLEAMASGLCVVSTRVGGIPQMLDDGKNALLVPPDDPSAMAAAVRRLLTEPNLATHISEKARQMATSCDWQPVIDRWEELLNTLIRDNRSSIATKTRLIAATDDQTRSESA